MVTTLNFGSVDPDSAFTILLFLKEETWLHDVSSLRCNNVQDPDLQIREGVGGWSSRF